MRLLHTADWHIGKRLYGVDRMAESAAVLAEVRDVAAAEGVDAVLVAGDLLDRRLIDPACLGACLAAMQSLAEVAPVVAVTGNHDDPSLWEHLAPYLAPRGITVIGRVRGGARRRWSRCRPARAPLHVAALPWLETERLGLAPGADRRTARGTYADDVAGILGLLAGELRARRAADGGPAVLLGHLLIDGAAAGGGERELTMGMSYAVTAASVPADLDYLALGHVHRPQPVPRVSAPGRYAGSPLALDFSEDNHAKSVVVAEIGRDVTEVREVPLTARRAGADPGAAGGPAAPRRRPRRRVPALRGRARARGLDLVREVRELLPDAPAGGARYAEAAGARATTARPTAASPPLPEHYEDWHAAAGRPLDPRQAEAFAVALAAAEPAP